MPIDQHSLKDLAWFSRASMFPDDAYQEMLALEIPDEIAQCVRFVMRENLGRDGYNIINLYQSCINDDDSLAAIEQWVSAFFEKHNGRVN